MAFSKDMRILSLSVVILLTFGFSGCGRSDMKSKDQESPIVARINNYRMSVSDFEEGIDVILATKYLSLKSDKAKQELLEELITKNVLLQEAQRQDLDKEKGFMKEIERYWERALLELLFKKKTAEFSETISVSKAEVMNEYNRMKQKVFAELVITKDKSVAERLCRSGDDDFNAVKEEIKSDIVSGEEPGWFRTGDLPRYLEDSLFVLNPGDRPAVVKCGDNWAVVKVLKKEDDDQIEPFEEAAPAIRENIRKRKEEEAIEKWVKDLRKNASVRIDKKVLDKIKLE